MAAITILTKSGGSIDFSINKSGITGTNLYLHIDQSYNLKNGEGEAAILINVDECKDFIASLNDYIKFIEGKDYVYTSDSVLGLLSNDKVQEALLSLGYTKNLVDEIKTDKINEEILNDYNFDANV